MDFKALESIHDRVSANIHEFADEELRRRLSDAGYTARLHTVISMTLATKTNNHPEELGQALKALHSFYTRQKNEAEEQYRQGVEEQRASDNVVVLLFKDQENGLVDAFRKQRTFKAYHDYTHMTGCQQVLGSLEGLIAANKLSISHNMFRSAHITEGPSSMP